MTNHHMNPFSIKHIQAREILDSRGDPTVATRVRLENGSEGEAAVPSGASTGRFEAYELRDGDMDRYGGKGVLKACGNVNIKIAHELVGQDAEDQEAVDKLMIKLDGRHNKSNLGANAILSVSLAVAKAVATARELPLYRSLQQTYGLRETKSLPVPLMNIINGGKHASTNIALQEFQIIPVMDRTFSKQLEAGSEVFHSLGQILKENNLDSDVGNEGGYAPNVENLNQVFDYMIEAITKSGQTPGQDVFLGLDAAATSFFKENGKTYVVAPPKQEFKADKLAALYREWFSCYPLISLEDPFGEEAWDDWRKFTAEVGEKIMIIGDDLFVTNVERLERGIKTKAANAILIKPNQIGTLSETMAAIKLAKDNDFKVIISHRSGETNDATIADLAVAVGAEYIKAGAPDRGERVAKYNRLLEIEQELEKMSSRGVKGRAISN